MRQAVKQSGIMKKASIHTPRHSYTTHLLEYGMDVDTLRKLLGYANLSTTLIYLHVARLSNSATFSPSDKSYEGKV